MIADIIGAILAQYGQRNRAAFQRLHALFAPKGLLLKLDSNTRAERAWARLLGELEQQLRPIVAQAMVGAPLLAKSGWFISRLQKLIAGLPDFHAQLEKQLCSVRAAAAFGAKRRWEEEVTDHVLGSYEASQKDAFKQVFLANAKRGLLTKPATLEKRAAEEWEVRLEKLRIAIQPLVQAEWARKGLLTRTTTVANRVLKKASPDDFHGELRSLLVKAVEAKKVEVLRGLISKLHEQIREAEKKCFLAAYWKANGSPLLKKPSAMEKEAGWPQYWALRSGTVLNQLRNEWSTKGLLAKDTAVIKRVRSAVFSD